MFQLETVAKYSRSRVTAGGNGGLAEAREQQGIDHPPHAAGSGGSPSIRFLSSIQSATSASTGGLLNSATTRSPANPPNPPRHQSKDCAQVIDLRDYLLKLCQRLPMPPEHLLKHYFTDYDIAYIKSGGWADPVALSEFIKTDPRFPFDGNV